MDEVDRLIRGVALVDPHAHQTLVADDHEVGDHEQAEDAHEGDVVPSPGPEAHHVGGVVVLSHFLGGTLQAAANGGGAQRDDQEKGQQNEEPDRSVGALLLLEGIVNGRTIRSGVGCGHHIRWILDVGHDVLDIVGAHRLRGHPTISTNVAVNQRFDIGVTGGGCGLGILDPLDQDLLAGAPAIRDARETRRCQDLIGHLVTGCTVGIEQGLPVLDVAFIPNARRHCGGRTEHGCCHDGSQPPCHRKAPLHAQDSKHVVPLDFRGQM